MGRRGRNKVVKDVEIHNIAAEGRGVGHDSNGRVLMVDYAVPGDVVHAFLYKNKKDFGIGNINTLVKPSDMRVPSFCAHFQQCGGCRWQHVSYEDQLKFKQQIVGDAFSRIGKFDFPEIRNIIGSAEQRYYRNKLEFSFSSNRWLSREEIASEKEFDKEHALGFHVPRNFDKIVDVEECFLQDDFSNKIRNKVRQLSLDKKLSFYNIRKNEGLMRNLIVRNSSIGQWMVVVCFGADDNEAIEDLMAALQSEFPEIDSLQYVVNLKGNDTIGDQEVILYSGKDHIVEEINGIKFSIGAKSFFQTNSKQCRVLYDTVVDLAEIKTDHTVYDLFTGTGSIANYIAASAGKVVGIDIVEEAIADAKENAKLNGFSNLHFIAGKVEELFTQQLVKEHGMADVIILDPPRAGIHANVADQLLDLQAKKIVYVSCNPATQARDISLLAEKYKVSVVQPVDMFPHTYHVENVVLLELV